MRAARFQAALRDARRVMSEDPQEARLQLVFAMGFLAGAGLAGAVAAIERAHITMFPGVAFPCIDEEN